MTEADVPSCAVIEDAALAHLRQQMGLAASPPGPTADTIGHLLRTDPGCSTVATDADGAVCGFSQAARRGRLWLLAHLFIDPGLQSRGVGGALLGAALGHTAEAEARMICATADPRAIRLYAQIAGMVAHPSLTAAGTVSTERLVLERPAVRTGESGDLGFIEHLTTGLRGGPCGPDMAHLLGDDGRLLVHPGRGYAVAGPAGPRRLAATDDEAATDLLVACLAGVTPGGTARIPRFTGSHQWALQVAVAAGMEVRPWGPLLVSGNRAATGTYLPHPALC